MTLESRIQKFDPGELVTMFVIDLSALGGDIFRITPGPLDGEVVQFDGNSYLPVPIDATGFSTSTKGSLPRPSLRISTLASLVNAAVVEFDDLLGATVYRIRTFAEFLDNGTNPDPSATFPIDVYRVERKSNQNKVFIEWELRSGQDINPEVIKRSISMLKSHPQKHPAEVLSLNIVSNRGRTIRPKTANQKAYVEAISEHTITFGIGPAGTGKTYLAMAKAVAALQAREVNRIILTRPAVEAGEHLGFLPGTLTEKIDPYLRPLFDALHDMLDQDAIPKLMQSGVIEVAPLAYMRGRTLNDSFIILDEAQNTTPEQMKMFLTRLGFGSKMVITGDVTQVDLPGGKNSGLATIRKILDGVDDISFMDLTAEDVVRHRLISDIVSAYEAYDEAKGYFRARYFIQNVL